MSKNAEHVLVCVGGKQCSAYSYYNMSILTIIGTLLGSKAKNLLGTASTNGDTLGKLEDRIESLETSGVPMSSSMTLPAKALLITQRFSPGAGGGVVVFDVAKSRFVSPVPIAFFDALQYPQITTKPSTNEIFVASANDYTHYFNNALELSDISSDGFKAANGSFYYSADTDSVYGTNGSNQFARMNATTKVVTSSSLNNPQGGIAVGGGKVAFIHGFGKLVIANDTTLAFVGETASTLKYDSGVTWNPLRSVFVCWNNSGNLVEVNPTTFAITTISGVSGGNTVLYDNNHLYVPVNSGIVELDAATNAILRTFTNAQESSSKTIAIGDNKVFTVGTRMNEYSIASGLLQTSIYIGIGATELNKAIYFEP